MMACHPKARLGPRGQSVQERGIAPLLLSLRGPRRLSRGPGFYRSFYRTGRSRVDADRRASARSRTSLQVKVSAFNSGANDPLGSEFNSHNSP